MRIRKWFLTIVENYKNRKNFSAVREHVDEIVFNVDPSLRENLGFSNKLNWIVTFTMGDYKVVYTWQIKGSLIEIFFDYERVVCWVDQSRQYDGFVGLNDIEYYPSHLIGYLAAEKVNPIVFVNQVDKL